MPARSASSSAPATTSPEALWQLVSRLWWASLVLVHLPVLATVVRGTIDEGWSPERAGSILALALTILVFAAKAADVRMLRLGDPRKTIVAMSLATVIAHHEAVIAPRAEWAAAPIALAVVTTLTACSDRRFRRRLKRVARTILRAMVDLLRPVRRTSAMRRLDRITSCRIRSHFVPRRAIPPRAPPTATFRPCFGLSRTADKLS